MTKRRRKRKRYIAQTRVWHTAEQRYYEAGNEVDLSHLSRDVVKALVEAGVVRAESVEEEQEEEENDAND